MRNDLGKITRFIPYTDSSGTYKSVSSVTVKWLDYTQTDHAIAHATDNLALNMIVVRRKLRQPSDAKWKLYPASFQEVIEYHRLKEQYHKLLTEVDERHNVPWSPAKDLEKLPKS